MSAPKISKVNADTEPKRSEKTNDSNKVKPHPVAQAVDKLKCRWHSRVVHFNVQAVVFTAAIRCLTAVAGWVTFHACLTTGIANIHRGPSHITERIHDFWLYLFTALGTSLLLYSRIARLASDRLLNCIEYLQNKRGRKN